MAVSGKKDELIERLKNKDEEFDVALDEFDAGEVGLYPEPFFNKVKSGGFSLADLEKRLTTLVASGIVLFLMIMIGLGSQTWYSVEGTFSGGFGEEVSMGFDFGLGSVEQEISASGAEISTETDYDECEEEGALDDGMGSCEEWGSAGTTAQLFLVCSMLCLIGIFVIQILRASGKLDLLGDMGVKHRSIELGLAMVCGLLLLIGMIVYSMLIPEVEILDEEIDFSSGMGGIWWMLLVFSIAHIAATISQEEIWVERFKMGKSE